MVFRAGRRGRPGLLGAVARTAVITGTAKATSNAMNGRSQQKAAEQQAYADQQAAYTLQQQAYAPAAAPAAAGDDLISKLQQLGELHTSGVLSDEEFVAAKAKLLG